MFDSPIPVPSASHYATLGVRPEATAEELREAMSGNRSRGWPVVVRARTHSVGMTTPTLPPDDLSAGTFAVFTADGKAVTPRAARERLSRDVTLFVTADAKPLDPYYAALLAPTAVVVVPQKAFRGEAAPVLRGVLFGQASASDGALRVRFAGGSATRTRDETNASTFGRVRVSRGTASEQVLELSLSAVRGYDGTDRMTQTELAAALATEGPFVLTENGRAPDAALTRALKPGTRVLVLPVPFREP
jgi:hypothetical protein